MNNQSESTNTHETPESNAEGTDGAEASGAPDADGQDAAAAGTASRPEAGDTEDEAPDAEAPDAEAPEAESPEAESSDAESPEAKSSETEAAEAEATDADAPDAESAEERGEEAPADEAGANGAAEPDEVERLTQRVEELEAEREEINDKLLRKAAELENYRRRSEREVERAFTSGKVEAVDAILDVLDDFERSIDAAEQLREQQDVEAAYESLKDGVDMVFRKFQDALSSVGVERIEAKGKPFDENEHEALMQQPAPDDDTESGTVLEEVRKGYRLGDRIVRHSRVIVAE